MVELCPECQRGFYCGECNNISRDDVDKESNADYNDDVPRGNGRGTRRPKNNAALKDQQSTGRKRAALAYPLHRDSTCEWANASLGTPMGGGEKPITFGCEKNQQSRHHGPDKNTLNNDIGNVHRICHWHHNNWHSRNDLDYDWSQANSITKD